MTSDHHGTAFGIHFASNQPLPEFQGLAEDEAAMPQVQVHWHPPRLQQALPAPCHCQWSGVTFALGIPGICDFDITADRIDVHPAPGVQEADVRAFLSGSAMGALLQVRGTLVLHGSAVRMPDGTAALFCGHSTAGKSTLAASLAQRGHEALADDLAALHTDATGQVICAPGLARTKLWRDALQRLGLEDQAGPHTRVQPGMDKHCLALKTGTQAAVLTRFYELQVDESSAAPLTMTPVQGMDKITVLLTHLYRPHYLQVLGRQNGLLADVARLAGAVEVHRITRPREGDTLPAITRWLESRWTASTAATGLAG